MRNYPDNNNNTTSPSSYGRMGVGNDRKQQQQIEYNHHTSSNTATISPPHVVNVVHDPSNHRMNSNHNYYNHHRQPQPNHYYSSPNPGENSSNNNHSQHHHHHHRPSELYYSTPPLYESPKHDQRHHLHRNEYPRTNYSSPMAQSHVYESHHPQQHHQQHHQQHRSSNNEDNMSYTPHYNNVKHDNNNTSYYSRQSTTNNIQKQVGFPPSYPLDKSTRKGHYHDHELIINNKKRVMITSHTNHHSMQQQQKHQSIHRGVCISSSPSPSLYSPIRDNMNEFIATPSPKKQQQQYRQTPPPPSAKDNRSIPSKMQWVASQFCCSFTPPSVSQSSAPTIITPHNTSPTVCMQKERKLLVQRMVDHQGFLVQGEPLEEGKQSQPQMFLSMTENDNSHKQYNSDNSNRAKQKWVCDYCNIASFDSYKQANLHEEICPKRNTQHSNENSDNSSAIMNNTHQYEQDTNDNNIKSLAMPQDTEYLSDRQCYIRSQCVQLFKSTQHDVESRHSRGAQKLTLGQVGIQCIFCNTRTNLHPHKTERSMCFPSSISRMYQTVADMQRFHFETCPSMPSEVRGTWMSLKATRKRGTGSPQSYWIKSARLLGLIDTDDGIRFEENDAVSVDNFNPNDNNNSAVITNSKEEEQDAPYPMNHNTREYDNKSTSIDTTKSSPTRNNTMDFATMTESTIDANMLLLLKNTPNKNKLVEKEIIMEMDTSNHSDRSSSENRNGQLKNGYI